MAMNNTSAALTLELLSKPEQVVFGFLFTVLSLIGSVGNLLVIIAVLFDAKMRTEMNILLLNLAIADGLNLLVGNLEWLNPILAGTYTWLWSAQLCPFIRFSSVTFLYTSILTQMAVCVERFIAIKFPMHVKTVCSRRKVVMVCCLLWCFSLLCALPSLLYRYVAEYKNCMLLDFPGGLYMEYKMAEMFIFYFFPLFLIIVLYSIISKVLWSPSLNLHEGVRDTASNETLLVRQKVVKMLIVCVCVYFVCYSPIQSIMIMSLIRQQPINFPIAIMLLLNAVTLGCSAANPIVYTVFSEKFRVRFWQILRCQCSPKLQSFNPTIAEQTRLLDTSGQRSTNFSGRLLKGTVTGSQISLTNNNKTDRLQLQVPVRSASSTFHR